MAQKEKKIWYKVIKINPRYFKETIEHLFIQFYKSKGQADWNKKYRGAHMSKTSSCIKMLQILNTGSIYKVSELASLLETNPRNVIEYKKVLEDSGYSIVSVPGRYGGYKLDDAKILPSVLLTEDEKGALLEAFGMNRSQNSFPHQKEYEFATGKILSSILHSEETDNFVFIEHFPQALSSEEINKRYLFFKEAISKREVITIHFLSNDNIIRERNIQPMYLFSWSGSWYLIAYCELVKDYRYFKLCRISEYVSIGRKFVYDTFFNPRDFFNKYGLTKVKSDEWYRIKFQLYGRSAVRAKDYCYGKDQIVTDLSDASSVFEVTMQFKTNIISFILGFGSECKVLEPNWLKEEIKGITSKILQELHD